MPSTKELLQMAFEQGRAEGKKDRPRGEWIGEADGYYNGELIYDTWYCSNCDYVIEDEEPPSWNYCPNCGCLMKGKYYV